MNMDRELTIEQVAKILNCSKDVIRRKIKKGEIPSHLEIGVYGEQHFISENALNLALEIHEVVPVEHNLSVQDFTSALNKVMETRLTPMQEKIDNLCNENKLLTNELKLIKQEQQRSEQDKQSRDAELMQNIRLIQEQQKKPWWQKILGR